MQKVEYSRLVKRKLLKLKTELIREVIIVWEMYLRAWIKPQIPEIR